MPRKPSTFVFAFSAFLLLQAAGTSRAAAQPEHEGLRFFDTGPLRIREQFLLGQGFLAFEPTSADLLEAGRWQVDVIQNVTNTWVKSDVVEERFDARSGRGPVELEELSALDYDPGEGLYYADGELYRTSVSIRRGIGHGLQLSITIPVLDFQGGLADSTIECFHDTFGFSQSGRDGAFRDSFGVYLRDNEGAELYLGDAPSPGLGDVSVGVRTRLPAPASWQLAVEGQLELPTGEEERLYGSGSLDIGAELLGTRYFERSCLHFGVSVVHLGENDSLHTGEQVIGAAMLAYEHAWGRGASVIFQGTASQSPFRDLEIAQLDEIAYLVDLGVKKSFGSRWVAFVAVSENLLNFGSSADVGLHLGMTWSM